MHAKSIITTSIDKIMDNLRLLVYLKEVLKRNMNGMNLTNSSPITKNINGKMLMNVIDNPSELPAIPKFDKIREIMYAYKMYAMKRPIAKATSFKAGF